MTLFLKFTQAIAALSVVAFFSSATWVIWHLPHYDIQTPIANLNATFAAINAPCVGFHGSVTCGPLAQLSQTEKNIGILAGQSALQVKQSSKLVNAAAQAVSDDSEAIRGTANAATGLLASAKGLTDEGKKTLQIVNDPSKGLPTMLVGGNEAIDNINALLKRKAITDMLDNGDEISASSMGIMDDFKKVADKATQDYVKPKTLWQGFRSKAGDTFDIAAFLARHY